MYLDDFPVRYFSGSIIVIDRRNERRWLLGLFFSLSVLKHCEHVRDPGDRESVLCWLAGEKRAKEKASELFIYCVWEV